MVTLWIRGGIIPPCPSCDAPADDQLREPDGANRALWQCLICQRSRQREPGWDDPLVPVSDVELRARNRAMSGRVRARWGVTDSPASHPGFRRLDVSRFSSGRA